LQQFGDISLEGSAFGNSVLDGTHSGSISCGLDWTENVKFGSEIQDWQDDTGILTVPWRA
jgi:hypothetical protein